jgi:hypothetical protein
MNCALAQLFKQTQNPVRVKTFFAVAKFAHGHNKTESFQGFATAVAAATGASPTEIKILPKFFLPRATAVHESGEKIVIANADSKYRYLCILPRCTHLTVR